MKWKVLVAVSLAWCAVTAIAYMQHHANDREFDRDIEICSLIQGDNLEDCIDAARKKYEERKW